MSVSAFSCTVLVLADVQTIPKVGDCRVGPWMWHHALGQVAR